MKNYILGLAVIGCVSIPAFAKAPSCGYGERVKYIDHREGGQGFICEEIAQACLEPAKQLAIQAMANVAEGTGINPSRKIKVLAVSNGAVFVIPTFIQKMFNHEVVVVVDENCAQQSVAVTGE